MMYVSAVASFVQDIAFGGDMMMAIKEARQGLARHGVMIDVRG